MPKIIENLRERLVEEARRQIYEGGYSAVTMRSVAEGVGVAVGTVYNYFSSKEMLIATYMLGDWQCALAKMHSAAEGARDFREVFFSVHGALCSFILAHEKIFHDSEATKVFNGSSRERHKMLREQISTIFRPWVRLGAISEFASEFISESLIVWTNEGKSADEIYRCIEKILK